MNTSRPPAAAGPLPQESRGSTLRMYASRAPITSTLIVLNALVFAFMVMRGVHFLRPTSPDLIAFGANFGPRTLGGEPWRLLTSNFIHIGLIHLLFNMYVLFHTGLFMEVQLRRVTYLVLYLVAGAMGSVASLAWNPVVVSAGASGAIFGLYGVLLAGLLLHRHRLPLESMVSLRNSALAFVGYNVLFGLTVEGIDMAGHLGGLTGGFLGGLVVLRIRKDELTLVRRVVFVVVAAVAVVIAALQFLPKDAVIFQQTIEELGQVQEKAIDRFNATFKRAEAGELSNAEVVEALEEVLAEWKAAREKLEGLDVELPERLESHRRRLVEYMRIREEGWRLVVQGLETEDRDLVSQGLEQQAAAARVFER